MDFDLKIGTPSGYIFGVTLQPEEQTEMAQFNSREKMDYMMAHNILGHPGRDLLLGTAEKLGWTLSEKTTIIVKTV